MEPEKITIIEGPTPNFEYVAQPWLIGIAEGTTLPYTAHTVLRTFNGQSLVERCRTAWRNQRDTVLEYRKSDGLRTEALIVAARADEVEDGPILQLWVRLEPDPEILAETLSNLDLDNDDEDPDEPDTEV